MTNDGRPGGRALALSFPAADLAAARAVLDRSSLVLLPAGGVGDLERAAGVDQLLVVELTDGGPRSAVSWRGVLATSTPLADDLSLLLPATWLARHPDAYARSRATAAGVIVASEPHERALDGDDDLDDDEHMEPVATQIYLPVIGLTEVPKADWLFTNELVPKQRREGRRFAPRVPTLVDLPVDD